MVAAAAAPLSGCVQAGAPGGSGGLGTQCCKNFSLGTGTGDKRCPPGSVFLHTGGGQLGETVSRPLSEPARLSFVLLFSFIPPDATTCKRFTGKRRCLQVLHVASHFGVSEAG